MGLPITSLKIISGLKCESGADPFAQGQCKEARAQSRGAVAQQQGGFSLMLVEQRGPSDGVQGSPGQERGMEVLGGQTPNWLCLGVLAPDPCRAAQSTVGIQYQACTGAGGGGREAPVRAHRGRLLPPEPLVHTQGQSPPRSFPGMPSPLPAVPGGASMAEGSGKITSALGLEAEVSWSEAEWGL